MVTKSLNTPPEENIRVHWKVENTERHLFADDILFLQTSLSLALCTLLVKAFSLFWSKIKIKNQKFKGFLLLFWLRTYVWMHGEGKQSGMWYGVICWLGLNADVSFV